VIIIKYIFFVNNISGIGGAQLYILRKSKFLKKHGYDIYIIAGVKNKIIYEEFEQFNILECKEILISPNVLNSKKRNNIIDKFISFTNCQKPNQTLIESHQTSPALWAEIFSSKTRLRNFVYPLAPFSLKRKIYKDFFYYKVKKNELIGSSKSFINDLFGEKFKNVYFNIPFDKNEILSKEYNGHNDNYDLNILTISRIEKTYIKQSIIDIIDFFKDKEIKVKYDIYLSKTKGDIFDNLERIIKSNLNNKLEINLKGPVNPLTSDIFEKQDVFIGMGTAVLNAVSMKVPSLVVDYRNNKYYGFFGYDHFEFGTSNNKAEKDLSYFLEKIISKNYDIKNIKEKSYDYFLQNYENNNINNQFLEYLESFSKDKNSYYNIKFKIYDKYDLLDFVFIKFFGIKNALKFRGKILNVINKNKNHL